MVADVQDWLDNPGTAYGWLLKGNEVELFTARKFTSREAEESVRPMLTIEFSPTCPWDCGGDDDGDVGVIDLLALLAQWDDPGSCDFDGGVVDVADLLKLLARWGPCD